MDDILHSFSLPVAEWFRATFARPTPPQSLAWPAIKRGEHTLLLAPTGSGKTLAAFLSSLDDLLREPLSGGDGARPGARPEGASGGRPRPAGIRVLYVSPLKALNNDIERNLRVPLAGIREAADRLGMTLPEIDVRVRSGDTPSRERQAMLRRPPQILITTPESLYLMLTAPRGRELFRSVHTLILDEIHTLAGTKRGVHLALSLERLARLADQPVQRIGLSATIRPLDEVARFLGGADWKRPGPGPPPGHRRRRRQHQATRPPGGDPAGRRRPRPGRFAVADGGAAGGGPDPGAPDHPGVRQQPPRRRADRGLAERGAGGEGSGAALAAVRAGDAGRRGVHGTTAGAGRRRAGPSHPGPSRQHGQGGAAGDGARPQGGPPAGAGRYQLAGVGHRHRLGRPGRPAAVAQGGGPGPPAGGALRPPGGPDQQGPHPAALPRGRHGERRHRPGDAAGRGGEHPHAAQRPGRAGPADRGHGGGRGLGGGRALRPGPAGPPLPRPQRPRLPGRAGDARRPLPQPGARPAPSAAVVGPDARPPGRPPRRPALRRDERRHHPRPGRLRHLSARRQDPHRRAGRGVRLRDPRGRHVSAGLPGVARAGDHRGPGDRHGRARGGAAHALLARRLPLAPVRAGPPGGRVQAADRRAAAGNCGRSWAANASPKWPSDGTTRRCGRR